MNYQGNHEHLAAALRDADPPLLTRINNGRVLVDPRTLPDNALNAAANVVRAVIEGLVETAAVGLKPRRESPSLGVAAETTRRRGSPSDRS